MESPSEVIEERPSLSRWERWLTKRISGGRVAQPGAVYALLLRRAARRPLYRRAELWLALLWFIIPALNPTRLGFAHVSLGFLLFAAFGVMPLWTGIQSFLFMRQMVSSGTLDELILTPLGVKQVVTDIHVFVARMSFAPLVALSVAWIVMTWENHSGHDAVMNTMWSLQVLNCFVVMGGASHLGVRLALGMIQSDVLFRRSLSVAQFCAVFVIGPIILIGGIVVLSRYTSASPLVALVTLALFAAWFAFVLRLALRRRRAGETENEAPPPSEEAKILDALERTRKR